MRRIVSVMLCVLVSISVTYGSTLDDPDRLELLEIVRTVHRAQNNTGLVFLLAHRGEVVLEDAMGLAVVGHDVPITRRSRFPIMSITKAVTGIALAQAVVDGLVDLDVPVKRYVPEYAGPGGDRITLRMLSAHVSGIPHPRHPDRRALYVRHFESATSAMEVYSGRELAFEPGTAYGYSSSGYNFIAAILEAVSGEIYPALVKRTVLTPLGLNDTRFEDVEDLIEGRVRNYTWINVWDYTPRETLGIVPTWDFSYNLGGGNMISTADDLLVLGQALLDANTLPAEVRALVTEAAIEALSSWTLGWIRGEDPQGRPTVHITGATPGVQAALYVYPQENLVFVALANCWGRGSADADLVIGAPQRLVHRYLEAVKD